MTGWPRSGRSMVHGSIGPGWACYQIVVSEFLTDLSRGLSIRGRLFLPLMDDVWVIEVYCCTGEMPTFLFGLIIVVWQIDQGSFFERICKSLNTYNCLWEKRATFYNSHCMI